MNLVLIQRACIAALVIFGEAYLGQAFGASLQVTVSSPFTIASAQPTFAFPTLHNVSEDPQDLMLAVWSSPDAWLNMNDRQQTVLHTSDGGQSWSSANVLTGISSGGHSSARLDDGTNLWIGFLTDQTGNSTTVAASIGRSSNGQNFTWTQGIVSFPQAIALSPNPSVPMMMFARSITRANDGAILATMYGKYQGDTAYRSVIVKSNDGGTNWNYYSTIAYHPNPSDEGYDEPVIERMANGDLLCVMRTGSYQPLQISRSTDDGLTWSMPQSLPNSETGVFPDLVRMSNGILALSYGRDDNHIMFSLDGKGESWTTPTTIYDAGTIPTCGYTAIKEVEPGKLLYIYSYLESSVTPGALSSIRGVYVSTNIVPEPLSIYLIVIAFICCSFSRWFVRYPARRLSASSNRLLAIKFMET